MIGTNHIPLCFHNSSRLSKSLWMDAASRNTKELDIKIDNVILNAKTKLAWSTLNNTKAILNRKDFLWGERNFV